VEWIVNNPLVACWRVVLVHGTAGVGEIFDSRISIPEPVFSICSIALVIPSSNCEWDY
jgi:hypothetical protein